MLLCVNDDPEHNPLFGCFLAALLGLAIWGVFLFLTAMAWRGLG